MVNVINAIETATRDYHQRILQKYKRSTLLPPFLNRNKTTLWRTNNVWKKNVNTFEENYYHL